MYFEAASGRRQSLQSCQLLYWPRFFPSGLHNEFGRCWKGGCEVILRSIGEQLLHSAVLFSILSFRHSKSMNGRADKFSKKISLVYFNPSFLVLPSFISCDVLFSFRAIYSPYERQLNCLRYNLSCLSWHAWQPTPPITDHSNFIY